MRRLLLRGLRQSQSQHTSWQLLKARVIIPDITGTNCPQVPDTEGQSDLDSPWFIFNDFAVQNVSEREALSFPGKWKVCIAKTKLIEPA